MKKNYYIYIFMIMYSFSFGNELKNNNGPTNYFVETIGKSQIHLQKIPLIYIDLLEGKEHRNTIKKEFYLIENHLISLKQIINNINNVELNDHLENVTSSFNKLKKLTEILDYNTLGIIDRQQTIIQFQLNSLYHKLNNEYAADTLFYETLKSNIIIANKQVLNLKKYKFNQKMFANTNNLDYLISNKEIISELNSAIDKLLINNSFNLNYDIKLSNLIMLVEQMKYNESHIKSIIDDTSAIFQSIRDDYLNVRISEKTKI